MEAGLTPLIFLAPNRHSPQFRYSSKRSSILCAKHTSFSRRRESWLFQTLLAPAFAGVADLNIEKYVLGYLNLQRISNPSGVLIFSRVLIGREILRLFQAFLDAAFHRVHLCLGHAGIEDAQSAVNGVDEPLAKHFHPE